MQSEYKYMIVQQFIQQFVQQKEVKTIEQSTISTSYYSLLIIYLIDNYISSTLAWAALKRI